jgi:WD40 repeat protein
MKTIAGHTGEQVIKMIVLNEMYIAIGCSIDGQLGKTIRIVDCKTGDEFGKLRGHENDVYALANINNSHLASGSCDTTIKIWRWSDKLLLLNLTGHSKCVSDLLLLASSSLLLSCSFDKKVIIWNSSSGEILKTITSRFNMILKMISLKNTSKLASCSADSTIRIWNLTHEKDLSLTRILTGHKEFVMTLLSLNKSTLISGSLDFKIKLWNVNSGQEMKTFSAHSAWVNSIVLLSNGQLASWSDDETIRIWNLENDAINLVKTIFAELGQVKSIISLTDGNLAAGGSKGDIHIWHIERNSTSYLSKLSVAHFLLYRKSVLLS